MVTYIKPTQNGFIFCRGPLKPGMGSINCHPGDTIGEFLARLKAAIKRPTTKERD